ncbi:hypothetical protein Dimus_007645, partial [Dionaea muscipula]
QLMEVVVGRGLSLPCCTASRRRKARRAGSVGVGRLRSGSGRACKPRVRWLSLQSSSSPSLGLAVVRLFSSMVAERRRAAALVVLHCCHRRAVDCHELFMEGGGYFLYG